MVFSEGDLITGGQMDRSPKGTQLRKEEALGYWHPHLTPLPLAKRLMLRHLGREGLFPGTG